MGAPLRSNIFKLGTPEQRYFESFPVQVAVLFAPEDKLFSDSFRDLFLNLDRITGREVAFFTVLDPPADWREAADEREWWRDYQARLGTSGYTQEDRVLVYELARRFQVPWEKLPVIMATTNLWKGQMVVSPTSPWHIEAQLAALTRVAQKSVRPVLDDLSDTLRGWYGNQVRRRTVQLEKFFGPLDALEPNFPPSRQQARQKAANTAETAMHALETARRKASLPLDNEEPTELPELDNAQGELLLAAILAKRADSNFGKNASAVVDPRLEPKSQIMIETALLVGQVIEWLEPKSPHQRNVPAYDYAPGAQGLWKAWELETNVSLIQAVRAARTVRMPMFFGRVDPNVSKERSIIEVNGRRYHINKSERGSDRQRFLTMGSAQNLVKGMLESPQELLGTVLSICLGGPLPNTLLSDWEQINRIRNDASHTNPLAASEYARVRQYLVEGDLFSPLLKIKQHLRQDEV